MISTGTNSLLLASEHIAQEVGCFFVSGPIFDISLIELPRNDWISTGQGFASEAGQGDLKGVLSQVSRISTPDSGDVDMPETASTLQLLIDRVFSASPMVRQVAAKTPGNLFAKIETPTPVPQATRPRVSVSGESAAEPTRRPISAPMK